MRTEDRDQDISISKAQKVCVMMFTNEQLLAI